MKHLHNFATVAEYEAVKDTLEMPYIVSIDETDGLQYNTDVIRVPHGSSGSNDNLEYLDVSNIAGLADGYFYWILTQSAKTTKVVGYNEEKDMFWYHLYPSRLIEMEPIDAVAVDLQEIILVHDEYKEFYIETTLRDYTIMCVQSAGFDNAEELFDSIPRITKEEFFTIPEKPKKPLIGAWIQHVNGTLYTGDQWTAGGFSNDEANGVAVINTEKGVSLVVAKDKFDPMPWSSMPNTLIEGIFTTTNWRECYQYKNTGVEPTSIIAAADPNSVAAACMNYTFPNGQQGYLPSCYEANMIAIRFISSLMSLIGRDAFGEGNEEYMLTSTQYDAEKAWTQRYSGMNLEQSTLGKVYNESFYAVCTLENYTFAE